MVTNNAPNQVATAWNNNRTTENRSISGRTIVKHTSIHNERMSNGSALGNITVDAKNSMLNNRIRMNWRG
jgi:hypothetical protein